MDASSTDGAETLVRRHSSRQEWIDGTKGLGILCVVMVHTVLGLKTSGVMPPSPAWEFLHSWLYVFNVPFFFFLSGLNADRSYAKYGFSTFLKSKVGALAYPYVVWQTLQILVMLAAGGATNLKPSPAMLLSFPLHPYMHFWFLYTLILVFALYSVLKLARFPGWAIAATSMGMLFLPHVEWAPFNDLCMYMIYFACGLLIHDRMDALRAFRPWQLLLGAAGCGLAIALLLVLWGVALETDLRPIGGILGIAGVSMLSIAMIGRRWWHAIDFIGRASLEIYVAHVVFVSGMRILLLKGLHVDDLAIHIMLGIAAGIAGPLAILRLQQPTSRFHIPLFRASFSGRGGDRGVPKKTDAAPTLA